MSTFTAKTDRGWEQAIRPAGPPSSRSYYSKAGRLRTQKPMTSPRKRSCSRPISLGTRLAKAPCSLVDVEIVRSVIQLWPDDGVIALIAEQPLPSPVYREY